MKINSPEVQKQMRREAKIWREGWNACVESLNQNFPKKMRP